jgi:hypothetical protein
VELRKEFSKNILYSIYPSFLFSPYSPPLFYTSIGWIKITGRRKGKQIKWSTSQLTKWEK